MRQILLRGGDQRTEEQARQELEAIRARVEAGEDFAQLATELSEDTFTAPQGGEMPPFGRGQILPEVEAAAFQRPARRHRRAGGQSDRLSPAADPRPFRGGLPPFEEMKEVVRRRMLAERGQETAEARAAELADRVAREEIFSAEALQALVADDPAVSFRTAPPFGRNDNVPGVGRSTPFSEVAFELAENGCVGTGPHRLRLGDPEAHGYRGAPPPGAAEVETEVRSALRSLRAEAAARERLLAAREEIAGGTSLEDVAATLEATVEQSEEFTATGSIGGSLGFNRRSPGRPWPSRRVRSVIRWWSARTW